MATPAPDSLYFDAIVAARSALIEPEEALRGNTTLSLETQHELDPEVDVPTWIAENFAVFLQYLRHLSREDRDLLLSYYVVGKTQHQLAKLHCTTQTLVSAKIKMAIQRIGTVVLGEPLTAESMRPTFVEIGLENELAKPLSLIVEIYGVTRSYQRVAEVLRLNRPAVRRLMTQAKKMLLKSEAQRHQALGAYLHDLTDKADAYGAGFAARERMKQAHLFLRDPDELGQFRVAVESKGFGKVFAAVSVGVQGVEVG